MGVFAQGKDADVTASDTGQTRGNDNRGVVRAMLIVAVAATAIAFPGYLAVTVVAVLAHELRRVRIRWMWLWAAVTFVGGVFLAGSLSSWQAWLLAQVGHLAPQLLITDSADPRPTFDTAAAFAHVSAAHAILCQLIAAAPLGFVTAAVLAQYRRFSRSVRGTIEGPDYSNQRPVGFLDRRRADRIGRRIRAGEYIPELNITEPTIDELQAELAVYESFTPSAKEPQQ